MAELRSGWNRVKFGRIAECVNDRVDDPASAGVERYVGLEHLDPESLTIRRWGAPDEVESTKLRFKPGDIIFGKRRAYQRKLGVADFEGICSAHAMVLRARPGNVVPEFLPFLMQSNIFMERAVEISVGSLSPTINWKTLAEQEFALPPLEEQRRIAALLRAQCDVGDKYAALADASSTTRRALGKQFFISAPEGRQSTIGRLADIRNGTTPRRNIDAYWGGTIPWLPTGKVNERRITTADEFITDKALQECSLGGILPTGTCLVAMIGEGITRGKVARLELPACINQNFAAVVPGEGIDSWYLFYYLESHYESLRRWSQGTNQQALNCSLVRAFPIFVPALARQREIANSLRELDERHLLATARLQEARSQLRQILTHLLSQGKI